LAGDPVGEVLKKQAALEKGKMLVEWLDRASILIAGNVHYCSDFKSHAFAGDNWGRCFLTSSTALGGIARIFCLISAVGKIFGCATRRGFPGGKNGRKSPVLAEGTASELGRE
jgi:hypothetical protein